ncbi:Uncharacterised protein [Pseudomonas fragi]|uniref:Uncharacterized protein n=1 Tax=Pseudomonas fragi TaxID=296 RepID=A0A449INH2_PSEFR|nr:Uncharacterised protein [Pseudomonas fragi]
MPSRASPLPQCHRKSSGSWFACDAGTGVCQANRGDAIASKPAPTMSPQIQWELVRLRCRHWGLSGKPWRCHREQARSHNVTANPVGAGSPAMQALGLSGKPWRCHREQARSHNVTANPVGAGSPAMQALGSVRQTVAMPSRASPLPQCHRKSSGSWFACYAGTGVCQANRGDAIASKPAPTMSPQIQWELVRLRCRHWGLSGKPWRCHREQARSHNVTVNPVGAGLPAMQILGSVRQTVAMPSRASPLPQELSSLSD